jgi:translocation and assembly module TamB
VDAGGRVAASGTIGLAAPVPADLAVTLDGAVLRDPDLYFTRADGTINLTGPLTGGARIAGDVVLSDTELQVPSTGITGLGDLPPVVVVNSPVPVRRTLERADLDPEAAREAAAGIGTPAGPGYALDVTVRAPRIFVRGRGLDAELGGTVQVAGTTSRPITSGGFDLVRGRLDILNQRVELDSGSISFQGSLTPFIRLVAVTEGSGLLITVAVEGPANAPEITFSSSPDLPQEEIVAQLIFGRSLDTIGPLQAIQLANSIAVLSGRTSGGLLDGIRGSAGLADLDLTTDDEGNVGVRAGAYISDNVYTDVQIDAEGEATVTLNLDVSRSVTLRGSAGAAGDTSLGIFFERDY